MGFGDGSDATVYRAVGDLIGRDRVGEMGCDAKVAAGVLQAGFDVDGVICFLAANDFRRDA